MPSFPETLLLRQKWVFWLAFLLIASVSALSFISTQRLLELSLRSKEAQAALLTIDGLLSDVKDAESNARGYTITGDRAYLAPYDASGPRIEGHIARLLDLLGDEAVERARIARIEALAEQRLIAARNLIEARARGASPEEIVRLAGQGKAVMDRLRAEADALIATRQARYDRDSAAMVRQAQATNIALVAGVVISLAFLAMLFVFNMREARRRLAAEHELRHLNAELEDRVQTGTADVRRARDLLGAVVEGIPDAMVLKDAENDFRYVFVNQAAEHLLGHERARLIGRNDHGLFPPELAEAAGAEDRAVVATGRPSIVPERRVMTSQGERIVEARKLPVVDSEGHRFLLGIYRDVTEQRGLEQQLRHTQRMDAVGQLTGGMAHDFNNLLAIIIGNVDLLLESVADNAELADMANDVLSAAHRGSELVRRLLAFARKQHLEPRNIDLNERLPSITALLRRTLGENIRIEMVPGEGLWPALVDPTQVDDAIVNLAINARDAMPGGGTLTIETANVHLDADYAAHHVEVTPGDYVMLAISDTGTGMPPEVIARAFEPFFTTKETGRGTGLGLSQVYGWVKQSGGHVKIYSELGFGTTIKLYLPRASATAPASHAGGEAKAVPVGSETILLVEDNEGVRRMAMRQLKELGYKVVEAEDATQAITLLDNGAEVDLLFTDIVMPGGATGHDLAREAQARRPQIRILYTSGYTELAARHGQGIGPEAPLLSKPYRKQDLAHAVRSALDAGR